MRQLQYVGACNGEHYGVCIIQLTIWDAKSPACMLYFHIATIHYIYIAMDTKIHSTVANFTVMYICINMVHVVCGADLPKYYTNITNEYLNMNNTDTTNMLLCMNNTVISGERT